MVRQAFSLSAGLKIRLPVVNAPPNLIIRRLRIPNQTETNEVVLTV